MPDSADMVEVDGPEVDRSGFEDDVDDEMWFVLVVVVGDRLVVPKEELLLMVLVGVCEVVWKLLFRL